MLPHLLAAPRKLICMGVRRYTLLYTNQSWSANECKHQFLVCASSASFTHCSSELKLLFKIALGSPKRQCCCFGTARKTALAALVLPSSTRNVALRSCFVHSHAPSKNGYSNEAIHCVFLTTRNDGQLNPCQLFAKMKGRVTCGKFSPIKHTIRAAAPILFPISIYVALWATCNWHEVSVRSAFTLIYTEHLKIATY